MDFLNTYSGFYSGLLAQWGCWLPCVLIGLTLITMGYFGAPLLVWSVALLGLILGGEFPCPGLWGLWPWLSSLTPLCEDFSSQKGFSIFSETGVGP